VRIISPDGERGRRISGFGSLSRGADFGPKGRVWYASEDESGKLRLFMERRSSPVSLPMRGYVQGVSFSPNGRNMVLSIGQGRRVATWFGRDIDHLRLWEIPPHRTALSPSVDDQGSVVQVLGPPKGPFSVYVDHQRVTPPGAWAAMPSFCSTVVERRIVYMSRAGRSWVVKIKSLTSGAVRTVAVRAMSPACSPDGRTVAFFSPGQRGKGPGIYLVGDQGGMARKVWSGQAAGLRWRGGERIPKPEITRVVRPEETDAGVPEAGVGDGAHPEG
jgi:TolB protein